MPIAFFYYSTHIDCTPFIFTLYMILCVLPYVLHYTCFHLPWAWRDLSKPLVLHKHLVFIFILVIDCRPTPQQRQPPEGKASFCISLTLEGHGDHYVKLVMQWCRGWVRTRRFTQPLGIHFDIDCCRPIPSNVRPAKGKDSHTRRSRRSLRKTCHAVE